MVALPYPVTIAEGSLERVLELVHTETPGNRPVVITDSVVSRLYARAVLPRDGVAVSFPSGERFKTRETWSTMTDALLEQGFGRDTTIIALGGGVVGDVAGFVAATYMRGVPYVQVPTTLLAMVDSSIGGKTGVDTRFGKNLVGAFHQPVAVVIDPRVLATLPPAQRRAGFAEVIKHGVVADAAYFERIAAFAERSPLDGTGVPPELTDIIHRSVEIKADVVSRDEREVGLRKVLNFGHTIGHAIEAASKYQMLHGECVSIGMVAEARLAERTGVATKGIAQAIEHVCRAAGLPTTVPTIDLDTIMTFTHVDKKARNGRAQYALPQRIGEMAGAGAGWSLAVEDALVREVLAA